MESTPSPAAPGSPPPEPPAAGPTAAVAESPGSPGILSPLRIVAAVCVLVPIIAVLWVPWFNRLTPRVLGFPFFYWYQLMWVVLTAIAMIVAFHAVRRDEAARRGRAGAGR
ncbi:MAG TPA: DUF3311 domain-containing protein [Actinocrinis sp.]|nr:DUF3311 domain-containing protein [Actinocrinis sp.]